MRSGPAGVAPRRESPLELQATTGEGEPERAKPPNQTKPYIPPSTHPLTDEYDFEAYDGCGGEFDDC